MKSLMLTLLLLTLFLILGCNTEQNSSTSTPENVLPTATPLEETSLPTITPKETMKLTLTKEESLDILSKSGNFGINDSEKSYTISELYEFYSPYFTRNYVDSIIILNLKQEGDQWSIAHQNSELAEGSYFETNFSDKTKMEQTNTKTTVTNLVGDGLYAAHKEVITLLYTDNGWRIDNLIWE